MASRYDENTKARAVRLVRGHAGDYETERAAMKAISARLGMSAETLRKWVVGVGSLRWLATQITL
jgi:transposase